MEGVVTCTGQRTPLNSTQSRLFRTLVTAGTGVAWVHFVNQWIFASLVRFAAKFTKWRTAVVDRSWLNLRSGPSFPLGPRGTGEESLADQLDRRLELTLLCFYGSNKSSLRFGEAQLQCKSKRLKRNNFSWKESKVTGRFANVHTLTNTFIWFTNTFIWFTNTLVSPSTFSWQLERRNQAGNPRSNGWIRAERAK